MPGKLSAVTFLIVLLALRMADRMGAGSLAWVQYPSILLTVLLVTVLLAFFFAYMLRVFKGGLPVRGKRFAKNKGFIQDKHVMYALFFLFLFCLVFSLGLLRVQEQRKRSRHVLAVSAHSQSYVFLSQKSYGSFLKLVFQAENGCKIQVDGEGMAVDPCQIGDRLRMILDLRYPRGPANPGAFDEETYLRAQGIELCGSILRVDGCEKSRSVFWWPWRLSERIRTDFRLFLQRSQGRIEAALLSAALLGEDQDLPKNMKQSFQSAGLSHLLVVSGGNTAVFISLLQAFMLHISPGFKSRKLILAIILLAFGFLCSWDASVSRAVFVYMADLVMKLLRRAAHPLQEVFLTAALLLLLAPQLAIRAAFLMSVSCSAAILAFGLPQGKRLCSAIGARIRKSRLPYKQGLEKASSLLLPALCITLAAQVAALPFALSFQNDFSVDQLLMNLLAIVLFALLSLFGYFALLLFILPWPLQLLVSLLELPLAALLKLILALLRLHDHFALLIKLPFLGSDRVFLIYALILLRLALPIKKQKSRKRTRYTMLQIAFIALVLLSPLRWNENPALYFLDVGQGSAVLILAGNQTAILYDCGPPGQGEVIYRAMQALGINQLELLIISHPHKDHYGGMEELLKKLPVRRIVLPERIAGLPVSDETRALDELYALAKASRAELVTHLEDATLLNLAQAELRVLNSASAQQASGNRSSYVMELFFKRQRKYLLLTADSDAFVWGQCIEGAVFEKQSIWQVPHHGAAGILPDSLPLSERKTAAVIQAGRRNPYGHPHDTVLKLLESSGVDCYRTDRDACIKIELLREGLHVTSYWGGKSGLY